jgi:hypothetical protein
MKRRDFIKLLAGSLVIPPVFSRLFPIVESKKDHIISGGNRIRIPLSFGDDKLTWKTYGASTRIERGDMVRLIEGKIEKAEASMKETFTEAYFKQTPLLRHLRSR